MLTSLLRLTGFVLTSLVVAACSPGANTSIINGLPVSTDQVLAATPPATCGPGSRPETGIQGRISREDHTSGRATLKLSARMTNPIPSVPSAASKSNATPMLPVMTAPTTTPH
jgi:hypothetical protein